MVTAIDSPAPQAGRPQPLAAPTAEEGHLRFQRAYAHQRDTQPLAAALTDALEDLSNPSWRTREAASRYLLNKRRASIATLRWGMSAQSAETRARSRAILQRILRSVYPELERAESLMGVAERMIRRGEGWRTDQLLARVGELLDKMHAGDETGDGKRSVDALRRRHRQLRNKMVESMRDNRGSLLPDSFDHLSDEETVRVQGSDGSTLRGRR